MISTAMVLYSYSSLSGIFCLVLSVGGPQLIRRL